MEPARANGAIVSARRGVGNFIDFYLIEGKSISLRYCEARIGAIQSSHTKFQALYMMKVFPLIMRTDFSGEYIRKYGFTIARAEIDVRVSTDEQGIEIDKQVREVL